MFNKKLKNQIKYLELENAFLTSVLLFIFSFILFSIIFFNTYLNWYSSWYKCWLSNNNIEVCSE